MAKKKTFSGIGLDDTMSLVKSKNRRGKGEQEGPTQGIGRATGTASAKGKKRT